jgi:hypothetical protein
MDLLPCDGAGVGRFWIVAAIAVVGGTAVLALIWFMVSVERRDEQVFAFVWTDLLAWAKRSGWATTDPSPELTNGGLDTVLPGERHRIVLAGTHQDHRATMIWCSWSGDEATLRYATPLVELAQLVPTQQSRS